MLTTASLKNSLDQFMRGQVNTSELCHLFRDFNQSHQLPEKFSVALENLLGRFESASLFTAESCSFSQKDLVDALAFWIDKASAHLNE